jgi:LPXTG-motif cell wall-anchored protein
MSPGRSNSDQVGHTDGHSVATVTRFGAVIALLLAFVGVGGTASAATGLTITPIEWNVVGLDSNSPADGPHSFSNGVSVCNTGSTDVPDLVTTWVWDSASSAISLLGAASKPAVRLAAGTCRSLWYAVDVVPSASSFDQTRRFHVVASGSGVSTVSTPVPREIYVEHLVSQNRNSITAVNGATAVVVGQSYTYTVTGNTATNGYGQLVASPFFDPSMFEVLGVTETYSVGGPSSAFYSDACGWDPDPTSATYRSCVTPAANVGGTFTTTVTVKVVGTGTTTMRSVVYDYSGSSYHYNSDFGLPATALIVTATLPAPTVMPAAAPPTRATAPPTRTTRDRADTPPSGDGGTPRRLPRTGPVGNPGLAAAGLLLVLTGAVIRYVARRPALRDC